jgi:hypothetical protein
LKKKSFKKLIKNWNNLFFLRDAFLNKIATIIYKRSKGVFILDEPWDNLIILDACRYDFFQETYIRRNMKGKLSKEKSRGSHTVSFLLENFSNKECFNIVYVTANPHVDLLLKDKFYKIISVWKDGWDEKEKTVLPQTMMKYALEAKLNYPNKKLIIHFMQPHYPYIGYKIGHNSIGKFGNPVKKQNNLDKKYANSFLTLYSANIYSLMDKRTHIRIYKANLEIVLDYIEKLLETLHGTSVVTSDHGEAFGERIFPFLPFKLFGHHRRFKMPILLEIPWLLLKKNHNNTQDSSDFDERIKIQDKIQKIVKDELLVSRSN